MCGQIQITDPCNNKTKMSVSQKKSQAMKKKNVGNSQNKVEKQKAKREGLIKKLQNNKNVKKKAILDMSVLAEPLPATEELKTNAKSTTIKSTKGKKYQMEREKSRFQRVIRDPIYQANPLRAVMAYLEHTNNNNNK